MGGRADIQFTGEERSLLAKIDSIIAKQKAMGQAGEEAGRKTAKGAGEAEEALDDMNEAAGEQGAQSAKDLSDSLAGVAAAAGFAKAVFDELIESFDRGQQLLQENIQGLNRVAALTAATTEEALAEVTDLPGLFDIRTKAAINFLATSAGITDKRGIFEEVEAARITGEDPLAFAEAFIGLQGTPLGQFGTTQGASFLQQGALQSSLDISTFAPIFARVAGVAGQGAEEQASAAAVLSSLTSALGGTQNAALRAAQALQGFLNKRLDPKADSLLQQAGVDIDAVVGEQLLQLADVFQDPARGGFQDRRDFQRQFIKAFGQNAGSKLLSLLGAQEQLGKIRGVTEQLTFALEDDSDISSLRIRAAELVEGSPVTQANQRRLRSRRRQEEARIRQGVNQADVEASKQEVIENLEAGGGGSAPLGLALLATDPFAIAEFADRANEQADLEARQQQDIRDLLLRGNEDRRDQGGFDRNTSDGDGDNGG